ncbi:hypothetical protein ACTJIJ_08165 [Niabella sp. 22666]|uniref:hypothetical protein n=1 Tax=Niabella sp. 22666 TaxID=3453954 RepID=UPI003F8270AA
MSSRFFVASLCLIAAWCSSCLNKTGKDLHPKIPEFPAMTNKQLLVEKLFDRVSDYYYNDSVLVCRDSATMIVYHFLDQQTQLFPTTEFIYTNGSFILKEGEKYFTVDDRFFERHPIKMVDESARLRAIEDSVYRIYTDTASGINPVIDSLFVGYFYTKYKLDKNRIPFNQQVGSDDYYIKAKDDEFILTQIPHALEKKISPAIVKEEREVLPEKNSLQKTEQLKEKHPHIKETGYAMMRKAWHTTGGGNHFIPAIPVYGEVGYYYYDIDFNSISGKFKILNGGDGLIEFKTGDRSLIVINRGEIYSVTIK